MFFFLAAGISVCPCNMQRFLVNKIESTKVLFYFLGGCLTCYYKLFGKKIDCDAVNWPACGENHLLGITLQFSETASQNQSTVVLDQVRTKKSKEDIQFDEKQFCFEISFASFSVLEVFVNSKTSYPLFTELLHFT